MALQKPAVGLTPTDNAARLSAGFDAIDNNTDLLDQLQGSVSQQAVTIAALQGNLAGERKARSDADAQLAQSIADRVIDISNLRLNLNTENQQRVQNVQDLQRNINSEHDERVAGQAQVVAKVDDTAAQLLAAAVQAGRPGACPIAFAAAATGPVSSTAPLDPSGAVSTPLGVAYRMAGAGLIAPRALIALDPDTVWVMRVRFWRLDDVLDPNNGAVDIGIQWLDAVGGDAGRTLLHRESNLKVQDGPRTITARVPSLVDERPSIQAPKGAVSWRPYLATYSSMGATAIQVLSVSDATFAGVYAPDVVGLAARLGTIEAQLAAGLPLTAPILPSYAVSDLPKPGNPGRKAFARDGRAPDASGALEPPNGGTGVEVTDNGATWVITGTNQQVQA